MLELLTYLTVIALLSGGVLYIRHRYINRVEYRKRRTELLLSRLTHAISANDSLEGYLTFGHGYFSFTEMSKWKESNKQLFSELKRINLKQVDVSIERFRVVEKFRDSYLNVESIREERNEKYIENELKEYSEIFDDVEGRSLDPQQRNTIVYDEDNNLVIAGAGSGKTSCIVGKIKYLNQRFDILPNEILLISFTTKSTNDLANRVNLKGIQAKTFHKFGLDVVTEVTGKKPSIFDERSFPRIIRQVFTDQLKDSGYLELLVDFFADFLREPKSEMDIETFEEYIDEAKSDSTLTYKIPVGDDLRTARGERVKSSEEARIANFLLFNGIDYEYEKPYKFVTATKKHQQYKPDFTIVQEEKVLYLEHLGISREGDVPKHFAKEGQSYEEAKQAYGDKIKFAREEHEKNKTVLIETYSHEFQEGIVYEELTRKLEEHSLVMKPLSTAEKWEIIQACSEDEIEGVLEVIQTFIALLKSNNNSFESLRSKNKKLATKSARRRNELFLNLIEPIYNRYQQYLREHEEIDFSDMINLATTYLEEGRYKTNFRYIVIDEFQDISFGRYKLVKAIKEQNRNTRLFCVGDDWQSIYRFSGSDISLFSHFDKYFGHSKILRIETTYRFSNPVLNLSSSFIQKNPNQSKKQLKCFNISIETDFEIKYSNESNVVDVLIQVFEEIMSRMAGDKPSILILGRYNHEIGSIMQDYRIKVNVRNGTINYKELNAQFMSIHKSKGLQADYVIVLNCNSGKWGFPSERADDSILNLLLSKSDQYENGEERRLFYVALTRAKKKVYLIADKMLKSKFITEIEGSKQDINKRCPRCKKGDLILRSGYTKGKKWGFYGCSNYQFGCDYQSDFLRNDELMNTSS
ncbi:UvrD-helicase domain-containing protein [Fulvivirga sedimenti]|uniref:DNA 3'-5' helicase n=1 Tax=Fulvivirga sedimenti TaxID=2879465 RepID=A0A9X1HNV5_9BACT|nr:UvrD-helicase domain-containing protein [Fulvivirga sedimenti]MCA6074052.1 UvrD-helicase domain-containing protein [Fulvivirga sedimenti]